MHILVCEFVCGGGLSSEEVPMSLFSEAFAMLRALIDMFHRTEDVVYTLFDSRIRAISEALPVECKIIQKEKDFYQQLSNLTSKVDYIICIAPETNGKLAQCTKIIEKKAPGKLIGSNSEFIHLTGNKWETKKSWDLLNIPNPRTIHCTYETARDILSSEQTTFVVKPLDGVGSDGVIQVRTAKDIDLACSTFDYIQKEKFILQEYINGKAGSCSFLCGDSPFLLTMNQQIISINSKTLYFDYQGGEGPYHFKFYDKISELANRFLKQNTEAKGWVGIDFVATPNDFWFIECNPRVTSSVVNMWTLCPKITSNNFKVVLESGKFQSLPKGYSIFKKVPCQKVESWDTTIDLLGKSEIASPPFPFQKKPFSFIAVKGDNQKAAYQEFMKISNEIQRKIS